MSHIFNPTDNRVEITLKGDRYVVDAKSVSQDIPEQIVEAWLKVHAFLERSGPAEKVVEKKEEVKEEVKEVKVEESVKEVEVPKKKVWGKK